MKKYIIILLIFLLVCLVPFVSFNAIIDPFYDTGLFLKDGLNKVKTESVYSGGRLWVANSINHNQPEFVIIGTSKSWVGMPRDIDRFIGLSYMNASIGGSNIYELTTVIDYLIENNANLKSVLFTLDFLTFSSRRTARGDFYKSSFVGRNTLFDKVVNLSSYNYFELSLKTLKNNRDKKFTVIKKGSRDIFEKFFTHNFFLNAESYAYFDYSQNRIELFKDAVTKLLDNQIKLKLVISPTHCLQLSGYKYLGIWDEFKTWKKQLTQIVDAQNSRGKQIELLNFSIHNERTMSPILDEEDRMQWFRDSTHYTPRFGNDILDAVYNPNSIHKNLYTTLRNSNIDQQIKKMELLQVKYETANPDKIRWINEIYMESAELRAINVEAYKKARAQGIEYELTWK